ncbi:MAG: hypothetical protein JSR54_12960, partial [Proteobacteria bacterium]|nr:hypothetical protein [Pseudomonadota bacterium]
METTTFENDQGALAATRAAAAELAELLHGAAPAALERATGTARLVAHF